VTANPPTENILEDLSQDADRSRVIIHEQRLDDRTKLKNPDMAGINVFVNNNVYSNMLGRYIFQPHPDFPDGIVSDDITTIVADGCLLKHYSFAVTGDANGDGSETGGYEVFFALYDSCPTLGDAIPIPGTSRSAVFSDHAVHQIDFAVPLGQEVVIPNTLYLGVSFVGTDAGILGGAPASIGFSNDRFGVEGISCSTDIGGFPQSPHASFNFELQTRYSCDNVFPGYINDRRDGQLYNAGENILMADDVHLVGSQCNMIAYEVTVKNFGLYTFDLRSSLSQRIPDTRKLMINNTDSTLTNRFYFLTPIPLPPSFWFTTRVNNTVGGPMLTCQPPDLGKSDDFIMVRENNVWVRKKVGDDCYNAINFKVFCEGTAPVGACCDMVFTDENGEASCNDVAQMNCQTPDLWEEGATCESICSGGDRHGQPCTRHVDCPGGTCPGPFIQSCGLSACCKDDGSCTNLTENECADFNLFTENRIYQTTSYCDVDHQFCPIQQCWGGKLSCMTGHAGHCLGGEQDSLACYPTIFCETSPCCRGGGQCISRPGCGDAFCCTKVCELYGHTTCCKDHWSEECATFAQQICTEEQTTNVLITIFAAMQIYWNFQRLKRWIFAVHLIHPGILSFVAVCNSL